MDIGKGKGVSRVRVRGPGGAYLCQATGFAPAHQQHLMAVIGELPISSILIIFHDYSGGRPGMVGALCAVGVAPRSRLVVCGLVQINWQVNYLGTLPPGKTAVLLARVPDRIETAYCQAPLATTWLQTQMSVSVFSSFLYLLRRPRLLSSCLFAGCVTQLPFRPGLPEGGWRAHRGVWVCTPLPPVCAQYLHCSHSSFWISPLSITTPNQRSSSPVFWALPRYLKHDFTILAL